MLGVFVLILVFKFLESGILEFGQFILTNFDWYHFLFKAHAFAASNLTLGLATSSGGVCFVLYVGGNLTIVDSSFAIVDSCFCNYKKSNGFGRSTYNYECKTCFFSRNSCCIAKPASNVEMFCQRKTIKCCLR